MLKWQSSFGRSVKIGERGRQFSNNCSSPVHTILKVIGPRFFQRRKRSRRGGRWSSRSCKAPNTKVSQRMCFRHAIQTEFKTLEFRNRLCSYWDYKTCQKSGETQALYQFCIKLPVFPLSSSGTISGFLLSCSKEKTERQDNYMDFANALDFDIQVILSERTRFSTLRFSLKIKSFTEQNNFYRSDILHDFSISSF